MAMGKLRSQTLPDLPHAILIQIAELLPLNDLPNVICSCRAMAAMATDFYQQRRVVDMSCFDPVTPRICQQLISRFSTASLHKLCFRYDLRRQLSYDPATLDAILARFLDNINPSSPHFQSDLRSGVPRMLDILAHCYYLDSFLSSQPRLRQLDVDMELSIFKVQSARGPRMDWHLLNPFVTLDVVQRHCSATLESYTTYTSASYNMSSCHVSTSNQLHVQMRFLERCTSLKCSSFVFVLGTQELDTYAGLRGRRQLALEEAVFYLPGWQVSAEQRRVNGVRVKQLGATLDKLKKAVVSFRRRGCLAECQDLFATMPRVESLYLRCDFNPTFPVYDIDEGEDHFFGNLFNMMKGISRTLSRLLVWGVPEDEFEMLFETKITLSKEVRELRVQLHWSSPNLDERRSRLLDDFLEANTHLEKYCIAGVAPQEMQPQPQTSANPHSYPVFFKAKNWRPRHTIPSSLFIFSRSKRKPSF